MSFTSLQKLAKSCKQFFAFDETGALSTASSSRKDLNLLTNLTTQLNTLCKNNKATPDNTAEHVIETGRRTKAEIFQLFLAKFKKDLQNYEHRETLDKFEVNIPENLSFRDKLRNVFNIGDFE